MRPDPSNLTFYYYRFTSYCHLKEASSLSYGRIAGRGNGTEGSPKTGSRSLYATSYSAAVSCYESNGHIDEGESFQSGSTPGISDTTTTTTTKVRGPGSFGGGGCLWSPRPFYPVTCDPKRLLLSSQLASTFLLISLIRLPSSIINISPFNIKRAQNISTSRWPNPHRLAFCCPKSPFFPSRHPTLRHASLPASFSTLFQSLRSRPPCLFAPLWDLAGREQIRTAETPPLPFSISCTLLIHLLQTHHGFITNHCTPSSAHTLVSSKPEMKIQPLEAWHCAPEVDCIILFCIKM